MMTKHKVYEVHPFVCLNKDMAPDPSGEYVEQCDEGDSDIHGWALYEHLEEGGVTWLSDYETKEAAIEAKREAENGY